MESVMEERKERDEDGSCHLEGWELPRLVMKNHHLKCTTPKIRPKTLEY